jgi:hypothetical protein
MKKIKACWIILGMVLLCMGRANADNISNNFSANVNQSAMDALAKDLGSLVGAGSFHQGKALGFPLGIDIGVHVPVIGLQDDNVILHDDGSTANAIWLQGEVGLPLKFNVIARGGKLEDADMIGGGLRYGLFDPAVPGLPSVSLTGLYSKTEHDYFNLDTYSFDVAVSFDLPIIRPYIGGGYDSSILKPTSLGLGASPSIEGKGSGYRAEAGLNLSIIPFTYITLAAGVTNGQELYHAGAGVKF